ncbi:IclR family transcriptional regulator [Rhodococcus ruber]|uniref:IclR family transcriptional regulator n=1 Tax=Rhodococcus ruber TaxID=1830 RepID=A0ABT4MHB6_9NOCA|nr:IclR family transcriptional regulator [Rhodococcus ruber]MCZ4519440.1 IclR family transcriptional regulator [Rhodococcus ruber]
MASPTHTALSRAAAIVAAFDIAHRTLSQTDIGRRTGLPLTTVHRICAELATFGALERRRDGKYQIGLRLWEAGALAPRSQGLREVALPIMEDLFLATRENVQLVVREGTEAVCIERIFGTRAVRLRGGAGSRLPIHTSSGGLVILASSESRLIDEVLAGDLLGLGANTVVSDHGLRQLLAEVRRNGFAICNRFVDEVAIAVAAPIADSNGSVIAALSIVVTADTADPYPLVPAVRAAARAVSRTLGST